MDVTCFMYPLFLLFKLIPRRKMSVKVGAPSNRFKPPPLPPVIITDRPNAVLSLRFHLFYVRCCSVFKCFNFNTSVCPIIQLSEVN